MKMLFEERIDGYVADILFRKRDPRFKTADQHKPKKKKPSEHYTPKYFIYDSKSLTCICPAGKRLYLKQRRVVIRGYQAVCFMGAKRDCGPCALRSLCLKDPNQSTTRQVYFFDARSPEAPETFTTKMKRKIDSLTGRHIYSQRLGTVEPVFANICSTLGLRRFGLRGKIKVNDCGQLSRGKYLLSGGLARDGRRSSSPDAIAAGLCRMIKGLKSPAKKIWSKASDRVFDVGFHATTDRSPIVNLFSHSVVTDIGKLGARIAVSVYTHDLE